MQQRWKSKVFVPPLMWWGAEIGCREVRTLPSAQIIDVELIMNVMKVFKVFTEEDDNSMFGHSLFGATVLANNEQEALDMVEKEFGDEFVGTKEGRQIWTVCEDTNQPTIVAREYSK